MDHYGNDPWLGWTDRDRAVPPQLFEPKLAATTELCGILFLWMAFIGIIPLYNKSGLIRLDFLVTRLHGVAAEIVWYITDLIGLGLGVVMIVAFNAQYRFVASRTYATMPNVHYTIQYIPMAIAGAFIALKSLEMLVGHIAAKKGGKAA